MKTYNIVDCVGIYIRRINKPARFFRFKTLQRRGDVSATMDRIKTRYSIGYSYAQTKKGSIF